MIAVKEVMQGVRYKQKDNNEVLFSDYDIIQSLNEALRYLVQSYALKDSDFLEKVQPYHKADMEAEVEAWNQAHPDDLKPAVDFKNGVDLPEDLLSIVSITRTHDGYPLHPCPASKQVWPDEFKVVGSKLYIRCDSDLLYRFALTAKTAEDSIELPPIFFDILVKMTGMILNNADTDTMRQAVDDLVTQLVPARRYANRRIIPVWRIR